jgi:hypothetical protein
MSENGPTFTKATYDHKRSRHDPPSPERREVAIKQAATDAAKKRRFWQMLHNDPGGWFNENFKK